MVAESIPFKEQIPVVVCAADPLSRAGIVSQLRRVHGFTIVSLNETSDDAVALMVADAMSDDVAAELRVLRGRGVSRVVLLVARVDDRDLLAAVEAGASGVIRRSEATAGNMAAHFHQAHHSRYGYSQTNNVVEIVSARLRSFGVVEKLPLTKIKSGKTKPHGEVTAHLGGRKTTVALYRREELFANTKLITPCIVTEYSATTLIDANSKAWIDGFGNLLIECL